MAVNLPHLAASRSREQRVQRYAVRADGYGEIDRRALTTSETNFIETMIKLFSGGLLTNSHSAADPVVKFFYENGGGDLYKRLVTGSRTGGYRRASAELAAIKECKSQIIELAREFSQAVIIGPGPHVHKEIATGTMQNFDRIHLFDVNQNYLGASKKQLRKIVGSGVVKNHLGDYHSIQIISDFRNATADPLMVCVFGSQFNVRLNGNQIFPREAVLNLLREFSMYAGSGGVIIIGYSSNLNAEEYNNPMVHDFVRGPLIRLQKLMGRNRFDASSLEHETVVDLGAGALCHQWKPKMSGATHLQLGFSPGEMQSFYIDYMERITPICTIRPNPTGLAQLARSIGLETLFIHSEPDQTVIHALKVA